MNFYLYMNRVLCFLHSVWANAKTLVITSFDLKDLRLYFHKRAPDQQVILALNEGNASRSASASPYRAGRVPCTLFPIFPGSPRARAHQAMKCSRSSETPQGVRRYPGTPFFMDGKCTGFFRSARKNLTLVQKCANKEDKENKKGDLACVRSQILSSKLARLPVIRFWGLMVLGMDRGHRHPARGPRLAMPVTSLRL